MVRRKQKSCHPCRARHLKCDGQEPCLHCRRGARECSKDQKHIFLNESEIGIVRRKKKHSLRFEGDQTWMELPSSVSFADSTADNSDERLRSPPERIPHADAEGSISPPELHFDSDTTSQSSIPIDPALQHLCITSSSQATHSFNAQQAGCHTNCSATPAPSTSKLCAQWPFPKSQEALLMRHYVRELAGWFDSADGATFFSTRILELASGSPALLNATFALSAKHLSLLGQLQESVSLCYVDACYRALLPDVDTKAFEAEHLAAVLILRLVMQMTDPRDAYEEGNVFLGVDVFLAACKANPTSGLHAQLFLNVLRLYIHVSITTQKPLMEVGEDFSWLEDLLNTPDDQARLENCRVTLHTARCVNYAYSDQPKTWDRWLYLKTLEQEWEQSKPQYLQPLFTQASSETDPFPSRMFATDVHAMIHQFFAHSQLLLLNHQPWSSPPASLGIARLSQEEVDRRSLTLIRNIIGTALTHSESASSTCFIATLAVTSGGHLLKDRLSQEHAYGLLHRAQSECAGLVPTYEFLRLRKVWGWDMDDVVASWDVL